MGGFKKLQMIESCNEKACMGVVCETHTGFSV